MNLSFPGMDESKWYVLRDLKRPNAKELSWKILEEKGFEVFTPLRERVRIVAGKKVRERVPVVADLLFVRAKREDLDREVERTATLQYRFVRGAAYRTPMTVPTAEMERFIAAVSLPTDPIYYQAGEITPEMYGRTIRVVDGPLQGQTGRLLKVQGRRKPRLLVSLPDLLTAAVEIEKDYIEFV